MEEDLLLAGPFFMGAPAMLLSAPVPKGVVLLSAPVPEGAFFSIVRYDTIIYGRGWCDCSR